MNKTDDLHGQIYYNTVVYQYWHDLKVVKIQIYFEDIFWVFYTIEFLILKNILYVLGYFMFKVRRKSLFLVLNNCMGLMTF